MQHPFHYQEHSPFFRLPAEVRDMIYELLLFEPESTQFIVDKNDCNALRPSLRDAYPVILHVCQRLYKEASPVLYSRNHFKFPTGLPPPSTRLPHFAPFLAQVRGQARLIDAVCVNFPTFVDDRDKFRILDQQFSLDKAHFYEHAWLEKAHFDSLELIRRTIGNVSTLELSLPFSHISRHAAYSLDLILTLTPKLRLRLDDLLHTEDVALLAAVLSAEKIVLNTGHCDKGCLGDVLMEKIHDCGWDVKYNTQKHRHTSLSAWWVRTIWNWDPNERMPVAQIRGLGITASPNGEIIASVSG